MTTFNHYLRYNKTYHNDLSAKEGEYVNTRGPAPHQQGAKHPLMKTKGLVDITEESNAAHSTDDIIPRLAPFLPQECATKQN